MFDNSDVTIILAGAGCGKTTELQLRVSALLDKYLPSEIAFVSFTQRGANEGKRRIMEEHHFTEQELPYMNTLHKLTYHAMGFTAENIFGRADADKFNKLLGFNITDLDYLEVGSKDDKILARYDKERAGIPFDEDDEEVDAFEYRRLVSAYTQYKAKHHKIDYTDCLMSFADRGEPMPVRVAIMDEVQDFNTLMWRVCEVAFSKAEIVIIAGDDYQSIYTYAGARPDVLIELANTHKTVKLEKSYRLPRRVYRYAKVVTDMLHEKVDKDYRPARDVEGSVERVVDRAYLANLIRDTQDETWLVLFRNNQYIDEFAQELRNRLVLYHDARGFVIPAKALNRIKKYYGFRKKGYRNEEAKMRFMQFFGIDTLDRDFSETNLIQESERYVYQAYVDAYGIDVLARLASSQPRVFLATVHKVKGAEARNVALFLDCTKRTYNTRFENLDIELRLLYVAITRAKSNLYFVQSESRYGSDDFVDMIEDSLGVPK